MELPANDRRHGVDPCGVGVEAWHESVFAAAGGLVELAIRHPHLFERFETVGRESWTHDREPRNSPSRQIAKCLVGIGLEPFLTPEERLKRHRQAI